jgi:hypothetical protein
MVPRDRPHRWIDVGNQSPFRGAARYKHSNAAEVSFTRVATWAIAEHIKGDYVTCVT